MEILTLLIIAISLSMDAFSLSLAYGTLELEKTKIITLSIIVGIYHFLMPLIGLLIGKNILKIMPISPETLVCIVLTFIGIEMIIESFKKKEHMNISSFMQLLIFGLAVSIDSFSVGIGLQSLNLNYILCALTFSLTSFIFTYIGLNLGKKISNMIGKIATLLGGVILIILGLLYL